MAQKCRKSRMSSGNKATMNKTKEECRQATFAKKREEGCAYEYKPIPYAKGTSEYEHERLVRADKNNNVKTPVARMTSIMRKLENGLNKQKLERKSAKERNNNRVKTA